MIKNLRGYLLTGIAFWIPIFVTVMVLSTLFEWLDRLVALLPSAYQPHQILGYSIPGIGLVLSFVLFLFTGLLITNWLGQKLVALGEAILQKIPLVRVIYHTSKQIIQSLLMSNGKSFRKVVMVEYPRKDMWTIGFQTGKMQAADEIGLGELVTIYIPTTPNPTSGFFVMVPAQDVKLLDISVEDALKTVLSLGATQSTSQLNKSSSKK